MDSDEQKNGDKKVLDVDGSEKMGPLTQQVTCLIEEKAILALARWLGPIEHSAIAKLD